MRGMAWLPDGEKIWKISSRFGTTHERDRQTDRRTPLIAALCIVSHGKNHYTEKGAIYMML